jgi:hypothetical protein
VFFFMYFSYWGLGPKPRGFPTQRMEKRKGMVLPTPHSRRGMGTPQSHTTNIIT